jgi:uncharacterized protein YbaA (DUF1428 family)
MGKYVDGFVLPLPKKNVDLYRKFSEKAGKVWREHGALEYIECIGDDVKPGKVTSFPQAVKLEPDETVVFAWIIYESREHRDRVNAAVMKDPPPGRYEPQNAALRWDAHVLGRLRGSDCAVSLDLSKRPARGKACT